MEVAIIISSIAIVLSIASMSVVLFNPIPHLPSREERAREAVGAVGRALQKGNPSFNIGVYQYSKEISFHMTGNANKALGALYKYLGLTYDRVLHEDVVQKVKKERSVTRGSKKSKARRK